MTLEHISERREGGGNVHSWVKARSTSWHVLTSKGPGVTQRCRWGSHGVREQTIAGLPAHRGDQLSNSLRRKTTEGLHDRTYVWRFARSLRLLCRDCLRWGRKRPETGRARVDTEEPVKEGLQERAAASSYQTRISPSPTSSLFAKSASLVVQTPMIKRFYKVFDTHTVWVSNRKWETATKLILPQSEPSLLWHSRNFRVGSTCKVTFITILDKVSTQCYL